MLRNHLQSFYLAALIHKYRGKKQYPYAEIRNFSAGIRTRSFQKENDNDDTSLSSSDDEFTPKYKKSYGKISMPTSIHLWKMDVKIL